MNLKKLLTNIAPFLNQKRTLSRFGEALLDHFGPFNHASLLTDNAQLPIRHQITLLRIIIGAHVPLNYTKGRQVYIHYIYIAHWGISFRKSNASYIASLFCIKMCYYCIFRTRCGHFTALSAQTLFSIEHFLFFVLFDFRRKRI